jgi:hypothetical protein
MRGDAIVVVGPSEPGAAPMTGLDATVDMKVLTPSTLTPSVELADVADVEDGSAPLELVHEALEHVVSSLAASNVTLPGGSNGTSIPAELVFAKASPEVDWESRRRQSSHPPPSRRSEPVREISTVEHATDEQDDAHDDAVRSTGPGVGPQWLEDEVDDHRVPARRMSGPAVALALIGVIIVFGGLALFARYSYRGDHDTAVGLGLPLRDAGVASATPTAPVTATSVAVTTGATAPPIPTAPPTVATAEPVATAPLATAAGGTAALVGTPPTGTGGVAPHATGTGTRPALVAAGTGTAVATPPGVVTPPVVTPPVVDAPDASATAASESFTQQAQKALEKEGEPRGASRAAELAWKATKRDPSNAEAWLTLGAAYHTLGNKAQAQQAYRSCAKQATGPRVSECRALAGMPPE